jgi:hypothetical protein
MPEESHEAASFTGCKSDYVPITTLDYSQLEVRARMLEMEIVAWILGLASNRKFKG